MKRKRFFAPDMRRALSLVKASLGSQAIIFGHRKVDNGVEIEAGFEIEHLPALQADTNTFDLPVLHHTLSSIPVSFENNHHRIALVQPDVQLNIIQGHKKLSISLPKHAKDNIALNNMQHEMTMLRGLMEEQLSKLITGKPQAAENPNRILLEKKLTDLGFLPDTINQITQQLEKTESFNDAWENCRQTLTEKLPCITHPIASEGGRVALFGFAGTGKTSSLAKLALSFLKTHDTNHLGIISLDSFGVGAKAQISTYAQLMNVALINITHSDQLQSALRQFKSKKLVLIDTPAISYQTEQLNWQEILTLLPEETIKLAVLPATVQTTVLTQTLKTLGENVFESTIITKTDEAASLGGLLSILMQHNLPASFISQGPHVSDALSTTEPAQLMARTIAMYQHTQVNTRTLSPVINFPGGRVHVSS